MITLIGQWAVLILSLAVVIVWCRRLRRWPLKVSVMLAMAANVSFFVAREVHVFGTDTLNVFSNVRIILMLIVIIAIPFSVDKAK